MDARGCVCNRTKLWGGWGQACVALSAVKVAALGEASGLRWWCELESITCDCLCGGPAMRQGVGIRGRGGEWCCVPAMRGWVVPILMAVA